MTKDSYWFRHDSTAGRGLKMRKMAHTYGHQGKGFYWDVIEVLRDQAGYSFDSDEVSLNLLSEIIGCKDAQMFKNWLNDCFKIGLFKNESGKFYSDILIEHMGKWETSKTNGSKGGRPPKTQPITQTKPPPFKNTKPKRNHKITGDKITEEKKDFSFRGEIYFDEKIQLEAQEYSDGIRYGNQSQRNSGGMHDDEIKKHCEKLGITYEPVQ